MAATVAARERKVRRSADSFCTGDSAAMMRAYAWNRWARHGGFCDLCGIAAGDSALRMVLKDGYRPVGEGMAIGIFIGLSGRAIIRAYLDAKINIVDPWMLAVVPMPLILAAFCACYLPARRAANVEPSVALRHL